MKVQWDDAVLAAKSQQRAVHKLGTRGDRLQMQNKEAIVSSCVVLDTNNNILNKSMARHLRQRKPHKSFNGQMSFVNRCVRQHQQHFDGATDRSRASSSSSARPSLLVAGGAPL